MPETLHRQSCGHSWLATGRGTLARWSASESVRRQGGGHSEEIEEVPTGLVLWQRGCMPVVVRRHVLEVL